MGGSHLPSESSGLSGALGRPAVPQRLEVLTGIPWKGGVKSLSGRRVVGIIEEEKRS